MGYPTGASLAYKVDHVGVSVAGAQAAFEFCRDELRLPVAWPFARYGSASTGGIGLGNLNLEWLEMGTVSLCVREPSAVGLIALQRAPESVDALTSALRDRAIDHGPPMTTGDEVFGFTNVLLADTGFDIAFFCGYHYPGAHDNVLRLASLDANGGGALRLRGVTELRAALDLSRWAPILGGGTDTGWRFDTGPSLVIDAAVTPGIAVMSWSVHDIGSATEALRGLGASESEGGFSIPALGGLRISITEGPVQRPSGLAEPRRLGFGPSRSG